MESLMDEVVSSRSNLMELITDLNAVIESYDRNEVPSTHEVKVYFDYLREKQAPLTALLENLSKEERTEWISQIRACNLRFDLEFFFSEPIV